MGKNNQALLLNVVISKSVPRVRLGMTAQMGADHRVKLEWLKIVEFSIMFFYKFRFSGYFVPKDRQTNKYGKLESTFLVTKICWKSS